MGHSASAQPCMILRPLADGDEAELRRIHATPEVMRWWDIPSEGFPWADEPEASRLTIEVDGAVAGLIQFTEELDPKYRHARIDLFLDPALHGRGLGTEAVRRVVRHLVDERGHHRPSTGVERDPMMGLHVTHDATALRPDTVEGAVEDDKAVVLR